MCTADYSSTASKCQCIMSVQVIPESPTATDAPSAADSPQPGPSGVTGLLLGSTPSHHPSRFVL